MNTKNIILPQPNEISQTEKDSAMGAYMMMFATWILGLPLPFFNIVAAIIYHFLNKKESKFVAFHTYQSLVSQIITSVFNAILIGWSIKIFVYYITKHKNQFSLDFFIYIGVVILINLLYVILSIIASVKAAHGKFFYFPILGKMVFVKYYMSNMSNPSSQQYNEPPNGV